MDVFLVLDLSSKVPINYVSLDPIRDATTKVIPSNIFIFCLLFD